MATSVQLIEKEVTISAPWGLIKGLTWGDDTNPPVLMVHGIADACSSFRPLVSLLPRKYFYVAIDLPGNGRSDQLPKGLRFSIMDLLPTLWIVKEHFMWKKIRYIGHSAGCILGKYFSLIFPDIITRSVELDPVTGYQVINTAGDFTNWYQMAYGRYYSPGSYEKFNKIDDTGPKYTYEEAAETVKAARWLNKDQADCVLERCLAQAPDGLFRFTYDHRMRVHRLPLLPISADFCKTLYTSVKIPILAIFANEFVEAGAYDSTRFALDEKQWPNGNYRCKIVDGTHDFFLITPESIANDISTFLEEPDVHSKL